MPTFAPHYVSRGRIRLPWLAAICGPICRHSPHTSPAGATLVVFHTAVLAYIPRADRMHFRDTVRALGVTWICNESPDVISDMIRTESKPSVADGFLLSLNERPVAWTDPHGRSIEWIG